MSSEVNDLIDALRNGSMSLEEVADRFRSRSWPRRSAPPRTTYIDLAAAAQQDPDVYRPGSFDDVAAAHQAGRITDDEYVVLSEAVADSKRAEDQRNAGGSSEQ